MIRRILMLLTAIGIMPTASVSAQIIPNARTEVELDERILQNLEAHGADLSKSTHVLFYFYFPKNAEEGAKQAEKALKAQGYETTLLPPDNGANDWALMAETQMVPNKDVLRGLIKSFNQLAHSNGGAFDGWEAAVTQ